MRRAAPWMVLGWLATLIVTAAASIVPNIHVLPSVGLLIVVFLALERDALVLIVLSVVLGALMGHQALAPVGLYEFSLALVALSVHLFAGNIAGSGHGVYVLGVVIASVAHDLLVFGLLVMFRGEAGFPTWASAALVPKAGLNGLLAWVCYPVFLRLDRRLCAAPRQSLSF